MGESIQSKKNIQSEKNAASVYSTAQVGAFFLPLLNLQVESEHVPRTEEVSDPDLQCCHTAATAERVPFNRSSVRFGLASKWLRKQNSLKTNKNLILLRQQLKRKGETRLASRRWRSCGHLSSLEAGLCWPIKENLSRDFERSGPLTVHIYGSVASSTLYYMVIP